MAGNNIQIDGLAELQKKYASTPARFNAALKRGMTRAVAIIHADIAQYPPESEANRPPGITGKDGRPSNRWYVRGSGTQTEHKFYRTSQALGRHWTEEISGSSTSITGKVGNATTYAPYVQSREHQAEFHKARGWKTIEDVAEQDADRAQNEIQSAIDEALRSE